MARLMPPPIFLSSVFADGVSILPSSTPTTNAPDAADPGPEKTIFMDIPFVGKFVDRL